MALNDRSVLRKPLAEQHTHSYRPRFNDADHEQLQEIAQVSGVAPATLIRHIVKRALAGDPISSLDELYSLDK